jgi:hypothetical protein
LTIPGSHQSWCSGPGEQPLQRNPLTSIKRLERGQDAGTCEFRPLVSQWPVQVGKAGLGRKASQRRREYRHFFNADGWQRRPQTG